MDKSFFASLYTLGSFCFSSPTFAYDYDIFQKNIEASKVSSVEAALGLLPADWLGNYMLLKQSNSLQSASSMYPRAVLFGKNSKLLIAFSGDPSDPHYNDLEIIQFRDQSNSFEFYDINFSTGRARFSPKNPDRCTVCHRQDPGPFWSNYSNWPEMYLSSKDGIASYLGIRPQHARYRQLVYDDDVTTASGNLIDNLFKGPSATTQGFIFGQQLGDLNSRRIATRVQRSRFYARFKNSVLTYLGKCGNGTSKGKVFNRKFLTLLSREFASQFPESTFKYLYEEMKVTSSNYPYPVASFQMEKIMTGLDVYRWDLKLFPGINNEGSDAPEMRYHMGAPNIEGFIGSRLWWNEGLLSGIPLNMSEGEPEGRDIYKAMFDVSGMDGTEGRSRQIQKICSALLKRAEQELMTISGDKYNVERSRDM